MVLILSSDQCTVRFYKVAATCRIYYTGYGTLYVFSKGVSLARENKAGGRKSIFYMLTYRTLFCLVVAIELFTNSVFQLYCQKDYYKQKQWNTLPVTIINDHGKHEF